MSAIELVFISAGGVQTQPTDMVFGIEPNTSATTLSINGQLTGFTGGIQTTGVLSAEVVGQLSDFTLGIEATYDNTVYTYEFVADCNGPWATPPSMGSSVSNPFSIVGVQFATPTLLPWDVQPTISGEWVVPLRVMPKESTSSAIYWSLSPSLCGDHVTISYTLPPQINFTPVVGSWNYPPLVEVSTLQVYTIPPKLFSNFYSGDLLFAKAIQRSVLNHLNKNPIVEATDVIPWRLGIRAVDGTHPPVPPVNPPLLLTQPTDLAFLCLDNKPEYHNPPTNLTFGITCESEIGGLKVLPRRDSYMIFNTVELVKLPGGEPIHCTQFSLSSDRGEWGWSFSAPVHYSQEALLKPGIGEIIELQLTINGTEIFKFVVEGLSRDRSFGNTGLTIKAKSRTSWLADPYARIKQRVNTSDLTAHQLVDLVLNEQTYNDSATYIASEWNLTDWLLPAKAVSHSGTAMDYISDLIGAAGGTIQSHRADLLVRLKPFIPVKGWELPSATPNFEINYAGVITESYTWQDKPLYDSVALVGGEVGGVIVMAKKTGFAGSVPMPAINHQAFTHVDAGRQRAVKELSATGRVTNTTITLPLHSELGIIDPISVVKTIDGSTNNRWVSTSVNVSGNLPDITQSVALERYSYA